jgi:hypothetical protein
MGSGRHPCVTHMCVFGSLAYAMVPDEKRGEFNAKPTKCMFLEYCESMKAYWPMCLETKKIIKNREIMFKEDSRSIRNDLEMRPSGRNGGRMVVVVDESSKQPLLNDGEQSVEGNE